VGHDVAAGFTFEGVDLLDKIPAREIRVSGQSALGRLREKTTLGMSFIGAA